MIKHPVMRYHGAKFRLAEWIISFFPEHNRYVEPFGGAAGVLINKPRSYAEVYNDLDGEIVNVFKVLRDPIMSQRLIEQCLLTPFSRDEFIASYEPSDDPVEQARRTLFRGEAGFGSGGSSGHNTGFRSDAKREYSLAAHMWKAYPERIGIFCERFSGVIIENRLARDIILKNDDLETLFYIDPPYIFNTRKINKSGSVYSHEMTDDDHIQLLELLLKIDGYVVLSGYDNEIYNEMLPGWSKYSKKARISSGRGTGIREEHVWLNPRCACRKKQKEMF